MPLRVDLYFPDLAELVVHWAVRFFHNYIFTNHSLLFLKYMEIARSK